MAALSGMRQPFFFLNQQEVLDIEIAMDVDRCVSGRLRSRGGEVTLESLTAAYLRPYDSRRVPAVIAGGQEANDRAAACDDAVLCWSEVTDAFVVSRPSAMASNQSKPYQSRLIVEHGFAVPATLLTTDACALDEFREMHVEVIYKSLSAVRSIVTRLTTEHRSRFPNLSSCPTQFQQLIAGTDIRVHVVGDDVFAAGIASAATDYRYPQQSEESPQITKVSLPQDVEDRCRALASALNLPVAGIDLRRTPAGQWYCFEVNPSPAFTYYEEATGQPIAEAVATLLSRRDGA
jgi:glutathione synthase/RimK-type ligase-like ATP-grasp enzyme